MPNERVSFAKRSLVSVAYFIWIALILVLSCWNFWPIAVAHFLRRIFRIPFTPWVDWLLAITVWLNFTGVLIWLPVYLAGIRRAQSFRLLAALAAFFTSIFACLILCTILWQNCILDTLYNCTDPGGLDFWDSSSNWVHNPVVVKHVKAGRSMSEPDTILEGWSIAKLEFLRLFFGLASFGLSCLAGVITSRKITARNSSS